MEIYKPNISTSFTNIYGNVYDRVRDISFPSRENIGILVAKTEKRSDIHYHNGNEYSKEGVRIYQSPYDSKKAYRIYHLHTDPCFNGFGDERLIQQLQEKQEDIKLSTFPTGVVTVNGRVIGQEINYFSNALTLLQYLKLKKDEINPVEMYRKALLILKEFYENEIYYFDIHARNFLVTNVDKDGNSINNQNITLQIIDFDPTYVSFENIPGYFHIFEQEIFDAYRKMVDRLNEKLDIAPSSITLSLENNFDSVFESLDKMEEHIVRTRK